MKLKGIACLLFFLNTALFATYYSISKEAMGRIDPIVFSFFEMILLVPVAVCILIWTWQDVNRAVVKHGVILGSWLCLSFFTIAIALKYTTATSTAFFPSLNGLLAAFIAWFLLRQPIKKSTWVAGIISVIGTVLLISVSSVGGWRGTLIAFLGGVFFTFYVFLADHEQKDMGNPWSLFAVETLAMAVCATFIALLFGNWQAVHPSLPKDGLVLLYIAGATTFLPILITVTMQKHISPVTVSFIYILEPVLGALFANFYLHETLPPIGYLGGGLVVIGAIIHTTGIALPSTKQHKLHTASTSSRKQRNKPFYVKPVTSIIAFMLFLGTEFALLYSLGGFPPRAWLDLYTLWPNLANLAQNGQTTYVILLWVQAICWLIAWLAAILMALLIVSYLAGKLQPAQSEEEFALRYYFSREETIAIPAIPALSTTPIRYPAHFVSPAEESNERVLVEEFLREYL
ncbi:MAG TPA: EamA family transporter [Ktedonobacteraceae bacterium]|nr:EamA family transporter [Ktedonobacteraceae bacterium]